MMRVKHLKHELFFTDDEFTAGGQNFPSGGRHPMPPTAPSRYSRQVLKYSPRYSPSTRVANYSDSTALLYVIGVRRFGIRQNGIQRFGLRHSGIWRFGIW